MKIDFTEQEIKDIQFALVYSSKELDKGNYADKKIADRLEIIENRLNELD